MGKKGIGGFVSSVANVGGHLNPLGNTLTAFNFLSGGGKGGSPGPKLDQSKFENRQEVYDRTKQAREASQGLISDLQKQAKGEGPSLAEAQLKSATSRNLAQTLAAAAAGRGSNPALTQRNVLQQKGAADRATAEQGAMLRMQEQQAARDQLGGLALSQQGQDLAQVMQPAGVVAQGEETRFAADVARRNAVRQQQTQLLNSLFQAGASGAGAMLSDERQKISTDGKALLKSSLENVKGFDTNAIYKAGMGTPGSRFAALMSKFSAEPQELDQIKINPKSAPMGISPKDIVQKSATTNDMSAAPELLSSLFGGDSSSDERGKKKITNAKADMKDFLDKLEARAYEYKDASLPGTAPGQRYGIMAQDLEKSKVGKTLVKDTPVGKMVDTKQGFGAVLAAQAELNQRLKKLEKKGKA